jgi:hypothetical protein
MQDQTASDRVLRPSSKCRNTTDVDILVCGAIGQARSVRVPCRCRSCPPHLISVVEHLVSARALYHAVQAPRSTCRKSHRTSTKHTPSESIRQNQQQFFMSIRFFLAEGPTRSESALRPGDKCAPHVACLSFWTGAHTPTSTTSRSKREYPLCEHTPKKPNSDERGETRRASIQLLSTSTSGQKAKNRPAWHLHSPCTPLPLAFFLVADSGS